MNVEQHLHHLVGPERRLVVATSYPEFEVSDRNEVKVVKVNHDYQQEARNTFQEENRCPKMMIQNTSALGR